jgi:hypothetical protein
MTGKGRCFMTAHKIVEMSMKELHAPRRMLSILQLRNLVPYLVGVGLVLAASLVSYAVANAVRRPDLTLIYLVAVVLAARRYGLWPSIWVSLLSMTAWDFFFTPPALSLYMSDDRDVFTLSIFMTVALIVSAMTSHIRLQNRQLGQQAANNAQLYAFSEDLSALKSVDEIADFAVTYVTSRLKRDVVLLLASRVASATNTVYPKDSAGDELGRLSHLDLAAEFLVSELPQTSFKAGFHVCSSDGASRPHRRHANCGNSRQPDLAERETTNHGHSRSGRDRHRAQLACRRARNVQPRRRDGTHPKCASHLGLARSADSADDDHRIACRRSTFWTSRKTPRARKNCRRSP